MKQNLLISAIICLIIGAALIVSKEMIGISVGAPMSVMGLIMFIWGMSLTGQEDGWSRDKVAEWTPSRESLAEAGRIMYRVDTTMDEPIISTILCGACGNLEKVNGPKPAAFTCPGCKVELWVEMEEE